MKTTLIALAAAGIVASGPAAAAPSGEATLLTPVQYMQYNQPYNQQYSQDRDRWHDRTQSVNEREQQLTDRIQRGISDGRLTDREARRLFRELNDIEAKERSFLYDGRLSRRETDELHRDLDRLRDHVRQEMRDEQRY